MHIQNKNANCQPQHISEPIMKEMKGYVHTNKNESERMQTTPTSSLEIGRLKFAKKKRKEKNKLLKPLEYKVDL